MPGGELHLLADCICGSTIGHVSALVRHERIRREEVPAKVLRHPASGFAFKRGVFPAASRQQDGIMAKGR